MCVSQRSALGVFLSCFSTLFIYFFRLMLVFLFIHFLKILCVYMHAGGTVHVWKSVRTTLELIFLFHHWHLSCKACEASAFTLLSPSVYCDRLPLNLELTDLHSGLMFTQQALYWVICPATRSGFENAPVVAPQKLTKILSIGPWPPHRHEYISYPK